MADLHAINDAINKRAGRKLLPSILVSFSAMISQSDMMNIFEIGKFLLLGQNSTIVFLQHQNKK